MSVVGPSMGRVPEPVDAWWARRQRSRGSAVPYAPGTYREAWAHYPVLVRQYRPEHNRGVLLSQVPPAADVWLSWLCDAGHLFVATPDEQRHRPGRERRRSSWCPSCAALATPRLLPAVPLDPTPVAAAVAARARTAPADGAPSVDSDERRRRLERVRQGAQERRDARRARADGRPAGRAGSATRATTCAKTPDLPAGTPFVSACAPPPASAVEDRLRADLAAVLEQTPGLTAVRLARPFFDHLEAWPDLVLPELRVAVEYDSTGRHGLEHVGHREDADRRKDRALRAVGWEVVRVRTGRLLPLGPFDVVVPGYGRGTVPLLLDAFRAARGDLFVDAWLR